MIYPTVTTNNAATITDFLFENFKGLQKCHGLLAPPIDAVFLVNRLIKPSFTSKKSSQRDGISPGTYRVVNGYELDNRFWLELENGTGQIIKFNFGIDQQVDWREVIPISK